MAEDHKRQALLLALSDVAMSNAEALISHIHEHKISENDPAYPGLVAGIVVNYARPFGRNDGLGSLPERFRKVGFLNETDLQPIHKYVMKMRNQLFAHFDLSKFSELTQGAQGLRPPDEIHIEFKENGFLVTTNEIGPPAEKLELIKKLLFVQRKNISRALFEHLAAWLKVLPAPGRYKLTDAGLIVDDGPTETA